MPLAQKRSNLIHYALVEPGRRLVNLFVDGQLVGVDVVVKQRRAAIFAHADKVLVGYAVHDKVVTVQTFFQGEFRHVVVKSVAAFVAVHRVVAGKTAVVVVHAHCDGGRIDYLIDLQSYAERHIFGNCADDAFEKRVDGVVLNVGHKFDF